MDDWTVFDAVEMQEKLMLLNTANENFRLNYTLEKNVAKLELEDWIKKRLLNLKAKIALPKHNNKTRNRMNLHVPSAENTGGLERICYLKIENGSIELDEYRGPRGDRFSGYYRLLLEYLTKQKIVSDEKQDISIDIQYLDQFIDCVNQVCVESEKENFQLMDSGSTYPRIIQRVNYDFPVLYYARRDLPPETPAPKRKPSPLERMKEDIHSIYTACVKSDWDEFSYSTKELQYIRKKIDEVLEAREIRKQWMDKL
ncbi:hypothetical protein MCG98_01190 [Ruminococcus sp. OA3]|uniref:hypothetical protein n=1 Tax=Ruminococcus sp. OA3 TaxID=2914164 RepID=UPI001F06F580|nr:hypothetical protein [Ruminococcus sp. OA3]MCH1981191.1 hypothetical protein [Ruminococcus sp. OA3]